MGFDPYSGMSGLGGVAGGDGKDATDELLGKQYTQVELEGITVSYDEARRLFEEGIKVEPSHGILYNAFG